MEAKLDRFGRVVLPKMVRDDLDLEAGDVLAVEEVDGGILLTPLRDEPNLVDKDGVLVFTGKPIEDVGAVQGKLRERRLQSLSNRKPRAR
jgi:AbrB family looped-hinge helix DNA binding protein